MSSTVTYKGSTIATVSNNTKTLNTAGKYMENNVTIVDVTQVSPVLQTKTKSYTPTESAQSETVTADSGYDGLSSVAVSVAAISSSYVGLRGDLRRIFLLPDHLSQLLRGTIPPLQLSQWRQAPPARRPRQKGASAITQYRSLRPSPIRRDISRAALRPARR